MTITQTDYVERVLIVLNPDGTLKGAHAERMRELREDGIVISARQDTQPLSEDDLVSVVPGSAALLADLTRVQTELDAVVAERAALQAEKDAAAAKAARAVSPAQARRALLRMDLLDEVEAAIAAGPREIKIIWEYASTIERSSPLIAQIGGSLGLSEQQIDELFALAATL